MARTLERVSVFIDTDKDGVPKSPVLWTYDISDGNARKRGSLWDESPTFSKTFHSSGAAGEFWRDGVDAIKTAEGIS